MEACFILIVQCAYVISCCIVKELACSGINNAHLYIILSVSLAAVVSIVVVIRWWKQNHCWIGEDADYSQMFSCALTQAVNKYLKSMLTLSWRITYTVRPLFCAKMPSPPTPYVLKSPVFSVSHGPQDVSCTSFYRGLIEKDNAILSKRWFDIWI